MKFRHIFSVAGFAVLVLSPRADAALSFFDNFAQGHVMKGGEHPSNGWTTVIGDKAQSDTPKKRYTIATDRVRTGKYSAHLRIYPGDTTPDNNERIELNNAYTADGRQLREHEGTTQYFAVSYFIPQSWGVERLKNLAAGHPQFHNTILQLHKGIGTGPGLVGSHPCFAISAIDRFQVRYSGGDLAKDATLTTSLEDFDSKKSLKLGQWTDFLIKLTFSSRSEGIITIWRRDEGELFFDQVFHRENIKNFFTYSADDHQDNPQEALAFWKMGMYRTPIDWAQEYWTSGLIRGDTFEQVKNALPALLTGLPNPIK